MYTYTLYNSPLDFPGQYVVRRFTIGKGDPIPDAEPFIVTEDMNEVKEAMNRLGLFIVPRSPEDDPKIVCTWI